MKETRIYKTVTRSLPCKLTDEELLKFGAELAGTVQDISAEEKRQIDVKTSLKAKLAELDGRRTQLSINVSRREEYREVRVAIYHDYDRGVVQDIREDTGECIVTRQMSDSERQLGLPISE